MMVLRFWNRMDLAERDREEVSEWLDDWHESSWMNEPSLRRLCAWELFKIDHPEFGSDGEGAPDAVPLGVGEEYLKRVAALEERYPADALESLRYGDMPR